MTGLILPFSRRTAPASVPVETVTGPVSPAVAAAVRFFDEFDALPRLVTR